MSGRRVKPTAELVVERKGGWAVKITIDDGKTTLWARPGSGAQKIIYDKPERVPRFMKESVVPGLINEAKQRNLRGITK